MNVCAYYISMYRNLNLHEWGGGGSLRLPIINVLTLPGSVSARRSFIIWIAMSVNILKAFASALFCIMYRVTGSSHGKLSSINNKIIIIIHSNHLIKSPLSYIRSYVST